MSDFGNLGEATTFGNFEPGLAKWNDAVLTNDGASLALYDEPGSKLRIHKA